MTFRLFKLEIRCTSATVESISKTSPGKTVVLATLPKSARILRSISFFVFFLFIEKSLVKSFYSSMKIVLKKEHMELYFLGLLF
ncbi:hypothetical protein BANRA_00703 [Escherichia coli]|nr:hypothetical protein BANRA_00703 [Escherichia coli]VCY23100.1 hypothetical protein BANRA_00607 [Escherichia coli]VCZ25792.1 hypothetical protein BANRA_03479 [Escherichia coli]